MLLRQSLIGLISLKQGQLESALPALGKARCVSAEVLHRGSERVGGVHGGFGGRRLCPGRKARFLPGEIFYRYLASTMGLAGDVVKYLPTCTTPDGNQPRFKFVSTVH